MDTYYRRLCPSRNRQMHQIRQIYAEIGFTRCLWCDGQIEKDGRRKFFCCGEHSTSWYSRYEWSWIRDAYLTAHPTCEECGKKSEEVHHILPFRSGGSFFLETNLKALCHDCHTQAHLELNKEDRIARKLRLFHHDQTTLPGLKRVAPEQFMGTNWDGRADITLRTIREAVK